MSISSKHKQKLNKLFEDNKEIRNRGLNTQGRQRMVYNFSKFQLSEMETQVLSKGLNFALCNKDIHVLDIISSVEPSIRNLTEEDQNEFHCRVNMVLGKKRSINPNITHDERKALKQLWENTELTIRRADKGGGIVLLNTSDYFK